MKATGIVRRIDDLGRVVIPKEIRRTMRIREGDPLEIYTDREGGVIFKKYSPIGELSEFASKYAESLYKTSGMPVCITDKDSIIATAGAPRKELVEKPLSSDMEKIMQEKTSFICTDGKRLKLTDQSDKYTLGVVSPIIAEGDAIGNVVIMKESDDARITDVEVKLAGAASMFLGKQMEL